MNLVTEIKDWGNSEEIKICREVQHAEFMLEKADEHLEFANRRCETTRKEWNKRKLVKYEYDHQAYLLAEDTGLEAWHQFQKDSQEEYRLALKEMKKREKALVQAKNELKNFRALEQKQAEKQKKPLDLERLEMEMRRKWYQRFNRS